MQNKYLKFLLIALIIAVIVPQIALASWWNPFTWNWNSLFHRQNINKNPNIVGGDKDAHGCIGSAGYTWCEVKNKCLRAWEEKCETTPTDQTVDWKTYTDTKLKISFKYPEINKTYVWNQQWPPIVTIDTKISDYSCDPNITKFSVGYGEQKEVIVNSNKYCYQRANDQTAGTAYQNYSYTIIKDNELLKFTFVLGFPECGNYDNPQMTECKKEQSDISSQLNSFIDGIVYTFKFTK